MPDNKRPEGEILVEEMSDFYVELVDELTEWMAPERPWWTEDLSADAQLWRWFTGGGLEMENWLMEAGSHLGWDRDETLSKLREIFTRPDIIGILPATLQTRLDAIIPLSEIVQANGPTEAAQHIRKMIKMAEGRVEAARALEENRPDYTALIEGAAGGGVAKPDDEGHDAEDDEGASYS